MSVQNLKQHIKVICIYNTLTSLFELLTDNEDIHEGQKHLSQQAIVMDGENGYPNSILLLRNMTDLRFRATYTCRAENVISVDESSVLVMVRCEYKHSLLVDSEFATLPLHQLYLTIQFC